MSVLSCDRNGCENIMCNRLSDEYGYICNDCFEELVNMGPDIPIQLFMRTPKGKRINVEAARARYEVEFPDVGGRW